jgi:hypothetical protein
MKCKQSRGLIFSYLDGQLGALERTALERHLMACPGCSSRLEEARKVGAWLHEADAPVPAVDFEKSWRRIAVALEPAPRARRTAYARFAPLRAPRWALLAAGFLAFFILGIGFARLNFSPARTATAAPAETPFLYSAREYFAALQPVLSEFSNTRPGGAATDPAQVRLLLNNLQLLRQRAARERDASLLGLLDDIELVLLEIAHLDRSDPENTRLVHGLLQEKGLSMKMKVFKFADRKTVRI